MSLLLGWQESIIVFLQNIFLISHMRSMVSTIHLIRFIIVHLLLPHFTSKLSWELAFLEAYFFISDPFFLYLVLTYEEMMTDDWGNWNIICQYLLFSSYGIHLVWIIYKFLKLKIIFNIREKEKHMDVGFYWI